MAPSVIHRKSPVVTETDGKYTREEKEQFSVTEKELKEYKGVNGSPSWIAIKGKVYNVSNFGKEHPGGNIIFTHAGQDATDVLSAFHPAAVYNWLLRFDVCELAKDSSSTLADAGKEVDYRRDISTMKSELMKARAFESSKGYYLFKVASNVAILSMAIATIVLLSGLPGAMVGGAFLALFWQQCGWLAHDFLHNQIFKNRMYNNFSGLVIGNVWQGFSTSWWKMKHFHHHASPNVVHTQAGGGSRYLNNAFAVVVREDNRRRLRRPQGPSQVHGSAPKVLLPATDGCCTDIMAATIPAVSVPASAQTWVAWL